MNKGLLARWRGNFLTGLAVVLPSFVSIAVTVWFFDTVSRFTDILLFFLPRALTHAQGGEGAIHWYWSLLALALAVVLIGIIGRLARYYVGRKVIQLVDRLPDGRRQSVIPIQDRRRDGQRFCADHPESDQRLSRVGAGNRGRQVG